MVAYSAPVTILISRSSGSSESAPSATKVAVNVTVSRGLSSVLLVVSWREYFTSLPPSSAGGVSSSVGSGFSLHATRSDIESVRVKSKNRSFFMILFSFVYTKQLLKYSYKLMALLWFSRKKLPPFAKDFIQITNYWFVQIIFSSIIFVLLVSLPVYI